MRCAQQLVQQLLMSPYNMGKYYFNVVVFVKCFKQHQQGEEWLNLVDFNLPVYTFGI